MSKSNVPQSAMIPYRRGIFSESQEYNVLTILEMSESDMKFVQKRLAKINTSDEAIRVVNDKIELLNKKKKLHEAIFSAHKEDWQYSKIDLHGRAGILKYKGIEVALFYQRQLSVRRINPEHPVSEKKLKNPADAWVKLDLTGLSARQAHRPTLDLIRGLESKIEVLERKLSYVAAQNDLLESRVRYAKKNRAKSRSKDNKAAKRKSSRHSKAKLRSGKNRR